MSELAGQVQVLFFASLREDVGRADIQLAASSIKELMENLAQQLPAQAYDTLVQDNVRIAVNQQLVEGDMALAAGDEVAFLPPVTGG